VIGSMSVLSLIYLDGSSKVTEMYIS